MNIVVIEGRCISKVDLKFIYNRYIEGNNKKIKEK